MCLHANLDFAGANLETQFKNFLEAMKNLKSAKIILSDTYHELNIPANIRDQRPLIMDVANPYDNFGKQLLGSGAIKYFTNAVETTLAKIKNSRPSAEWFWKFTTSFLNAFPVFLGAFSVNFFYSNFCQLKKNSVKVFV